MQNTFMKKKLNENITQLECEARNKKQYEVKTI